MGGGGSEGVAARGMKTQRDRPESGRDSLACFTLTCVLLCFVTLHCVDDSV